jgi:hypothetical protein
MHKQPPTGNRLARLIRQLLPRALLQPTKHKLRLQLPVGRDIPDLRGLLIGQRVVVLEVSAQAFGFESCPGCELVHGGGVFGPLGELVGVEGDFVLERFDGVAGFVEEDLLGRDRVSQSVGSVGRLRYIRQNLQFHTRRGIPQCGSQSTPTCPQAQ